MTTYEVKSRHVTIPLGRQGENNARQVLFKSSYLTSGLDDGGEIVLLHQRKGDDAPYPVAITTEDEYIVWTVTSADVAVAGLGQCELQYIVDDVIKKSRIWDTRTLAALEEAGDAPDPETGWVADLIARITELVSETSVDDDVIAAAVENYLSENAITAESLGALTQDDLAEAIATALTESKESGEFDGADGVGIASVEQTTTSTDSGGENVVTVTLSDGSTSDFKVYNGAQGEQGEKGDAGEKGETGDTGADGKSAYEIAVENGYEGTESEWLESLKGDTGDAYTLTDTDKNDIATIVLTLVTDGDEVSY